MVAPGETIFVPTELTGIDPGSRTTEIAPDTFQLNVVEPPTNMLGGDAEKEFITGSPEGNGIIPLTTTCTVAVTTPALFVAVNR